MRLCLFLNEASSNYSIPSICEIDLLCFKGGKKSFSLPISGSPSGALQMRVAEDPLTRENKQTFINIYTAHVHIRVASNE